VHGLLQTADYAREILAAGDPADRSEQIELAITTRAARQQRLTGEAPIQLAVILGEAVLRPIGRPDMMRAQLEYVVGRAALANVELRVLPLAAHAGICGAFVRFREDPDLVFIETCGGDMYIAYTDAWRRLEAVALSERESKALIAAAAKEMS
jgi:hypothetical protein